MVIIDHLKETAFCMPKVHMTIKFGTRSINQSISIALVAEQLQG